MSKSASGAPAEISIHQLRIFTAVAQASTLTEAAKQLGITQPSLSQQLSRLETMVGTRLFNRRPGEMELTESGQYLLPKAEHVLRGMRDLEDGLLQFTTGRRVTIRVAGIASALRILLPAALHHVRQTFPDIDFDIQDRAPADILELLYERRIAVGLLADNSVADSGGGFLQIPLLADAHVLAVPDHIDLASVRDPRRDLSAAHYATLNQSIQFSFGTQHTKRVQHWYERLFPEHQVVAQCRSFEVATELVRAGAGICLVPTLSVLHGAQPLEGVKLYKVNAAPRRIVALIPSQYQRIEPYRTFLDALEAVGRETELPQTLPIPPFLDDGEQARF